MVDEKNEEWVDKQKFLDMLRLRKREICLAFPNWKNSEFLKFLAKFCRANESCFHADARLHAVAEGRREVWILLTDYLTLEAEEIHEKRYKSPLFEPKGE